MTEIEFKQKGKMWVGETDSLGRSVLQITRKSGGYLCIGRFLPEMDSVPLVTSAQADKNEIIELNVPKGMKINIVSDSEIVKCKIIATNLIITPEGTLMTDDIVNDLTTGGVDKPLSAEQGKILKQQVDQNHKSALKSSDLVNDLTSSDTNKALTAAQGKALKEQIEKKEIPGLATINKAGLVKKLKNIAKPAGATPEQIKASVDALIDDLILKGMMEGA